MITLKQGDCLELMKGLPNDSIDAIITDPPYGYSFMGKDWDKSTPSVDIWKECLRVLKAGSFAMIMSAPRLDVQGEMAVKLQQAGFRVDFTPIFWAYASGFPKAGNASKMADKKLGVKQEIIGIAKGMGKQNPQWNGTENGRAENSFKPEYELTSATSTKAKELEGAYLGFQPKPAVEVAYCQVLFLCYLERV